MKGLSASHVLWAYENLILGWRSEGLTLTQIQAKLAAEHIDVSTVSISNVLKGRAT